MGFDINYSITIVASKTLVINKIQEHIILAAIFFQRRMLIDILQFNHNPVNLFLCFFVLFEQTCSTITSSCVYTGSSNYNNISANMNQFLLYWLLELCGRFVIFNDMAVMAPI
jgi:hypothetical protein